MTLAPDPDPPSSLRKESPVDGAVVQCHPDGSIVYRASSLGGCDMMLLAGRLEYEAIPLKEDAPIQKAFDRGHASEKVMCDMLRSQTDWFISDRPEEMKEVAIQVSSKVRVVGHYDDLVQQPGRALVEYKSQNQDEWNLFERDGWESGFLPRYKWQVSCYMNALNLPMIFVRGLWDGEKIVEIKWSRLEVPFYSLAEIRARVLRIEAVAQTGVLAAECTVQYPCPYFYLHEELDRELVDDHVIEKLAVEYEEAKRDMAVAKGKQEAVRKALREAAENDKLQTANGTKVTFYMAANPPSIDKLNLDAFLAKNGSSLAEFSRQSKSERIRVTLPKEDGTDGEGSGEAPHQ